MRKASENEWEIESVKNRYLGTPGIELTNEQALKVLSIDIAKRAANFKYTLSIWEELDYEEAVFSDILNQKQFASYKLQKQEQLKQVEANLIETDKEYLPQLNAAKERYTYEKDIFLPSLLRSLLHVRMAFNHEKEKLEYLKAEYKRFVAEEKQRILMQHFRHSRIYQPVLLKLSLLRHQEICLIPAYFAFKGNFDSATSAVASFLLEKIERIADDFADAITPSIKALQEFNAGNTSKHIGEITGWHVTLPAENPTEEFMSALLADPKLYTS